jgi:Na+/melibiose symporter-like transporter
MATYGVASAFALNAISYLAVILSLWAIDMNQSKRAQEPQGFFQELFQGFRYSVTHPTIRHLLLLAGLNSLLARGALELLPVYADAYNRGSVGLAMLLTASGGGALLAGICLSYQRYHRRLLDYSEKCAILCGVMLLLLGTSTVYPMGVISVALLAFVMTLSAVGFQVILQSVVEDGYRGRVVALWSVINIATPALGGAIIGALSQWIPLPNMSVVIGLGCTIASWLLVRRSEIVWPETESNKR